MDSIQLFLLFLSILKKKSSHISVMGSVDSESRSVGFEPTTLGFGDPHSTFRFLFFQVFL